MSDELWTEVQEIVSHSALAVLTTVSEAGDPHAKWMSTFSRDNLSEILTLTSPDSRKVQNIRANGRAEWMFTARDKETVIYLSGPTEIVEDTAEIKRCWDRIPDKTHAYFMQYYNTGIGFAVVRTRVEEVILCRPKAFRKTKVEIPRSGEG